MYLKALLKQTHTHTHFKLIACVFSNLLHFMLYFEFIYYKCLCVCD